MHDSHDDHTHDHLHSSEDTGHTHQHPHGHSHDHSHEHKHEHSHTHSHEHNHEHGHSHTHEGEAHTHTHTPPAGGDLDKTLAILNYMLDHNRAHAQELAGLAGKLEAAGMAEAARLVQEGVEEFDKGNQKLAQSLEMIQEG